MAGLALVAMALMITRHHVLHTFQDAESQTQWDSWRRDVEAQQGKSGPVTRQPVRSHEPPPLVLMRDYFGVCFLMAMVLSGVLSAVLLTFARGAFKS